MNNTSDEVILGRRTFLPSVTRVIGTAMVTSLSGVSLAGSSGQTFTVKQMIDIIMKEISGAPFTTTVDQLRSGSPDQEVTGIVTTMVSYDRRNRANRQRRC